MSDNDVRLTDEALAELLESYEKQLPWLNTPEVSALLCLRELVAKRAELARLQAECVALKAANTRLQDQLEDCIHADESPA